MITVKGNIIDQNTKEALLNANVQIVDNAGAPKLVNGNIIGRTADEKGAFILPVALPDSFVKITYTGYTPLILPASKAANQTTFEMQSNNALNEVVITAKKHLKNNWIWWVVGVFAVVIIGTGIYFLTKKSK